VPVVVPHLDSATETHLQKQADDLATEFHGVVSPETVERVVAESIEALGEVRFGDYIPVLAYRFSRERLAAIGQVQGQLVKEVPEVLFVCVENAGRSQMTAALLDHRAEGRAHVRSAGSEPAAPINRNVAEAMRELGIDIAREFPKPLTDEVVRATDVVITMGCGDACPVYPGKLYRDWEAEDPKGKGLDDVRRIRDDIDVRVRDLLRELANQSPA
jgi:arsenate reductase